MGIDDAIILRLHDSDKNLQLHVNKNCDHQNWTGGTLTLREKYPNTELLLVCIFPYSVRIKENMDQKKLRIWILLHCQTYQFSPD